MFIKILLHSPIILVIIIGIAKFIMTTTVSIQTIAFLVIKKPFFSLKHVNLDPFIFPFTYSKEL